MKYFIEAIIKWNDFSGKSNLKSFWIFFLIYTLTAMPVGFIQSWSGIDNLGLVYIILMLLPYNAFGFRRLNDAGINKFLFLIPFVGLILATFPSKESK